LGETLTNVIMLRWVECGWLCLQCRNFATRERERERERDTCFYPVVSRTCFSVWFKVCIEIACTHLYRNSVQYAVYCTVSKPSVLNNEYQSLKQSSDNFNAKYVYKM